MGTPGRGVDNMFINYCDIRYAEVLLLAAEANLGTNQAKADEYLNQVRRRARLSDKSGITLDDVKLEKRLELCFEGARYLDLLRWGDAYDVLKSQGKDNYYLKVSKSGDGYTYERAIQDTNNNAGFKKGKNELLPIPMGEIEVNGENVNQNPGW